MDKEQNGQYLNILNRIHQLEERVKFLEGKRTQPASSFVQPEFDERDEKLFGSLSSGNLESTFGHIGLGLLGNLVLAFCIVYCVQLLLAGGSVLPAYIIGFASAAVVFFVSMRLKENYPDLASMFNYTGHFFLFFFILKLGYFTGQPLLRPELVSVLLLVLMVIQFYLAFKNKSRFFAFFIFLMAFVGALISENTLIILFSVSIISVLSVWLFSKISWWKLCLWITALSYLVFFLWQTGNPFLGNPVSISNANQWAYLVLVLMGIVYSFPTLKKKDDSFPESFVIKEIIINGFGFSLILVLAVMNVFEKNYSLLMGIIFVFAFLFSVFLKTRTGRLIPASLYALYSFLCLSVAAYGLYGFPEVYFLLSLQSLVVISVALWFRSKFIVFMNMILFIVLILAYFIGDTRYSIVDFSFPVVALVSARILNWKKDRLEIKTEMLRNTYLFIAFFLVIYALSVTVSSGFLTISLTLAAIVYFIVSLLLKKIKYRWMALFTLLVAIGHLLFYDLKSIDLIYRILATMLVAAVSIGISFYYSRKRKSGQSENE